MRFYEYFIGLRYLRAKPAQTVMSLGGVALGIVVVIVALAIFSGFEQTLRDNLLGSEAHILVLSPGGFEDYATFVEQVETLPGAVAATPVVTQEALVQNYSNRQRSKGVQIRGIDPKSSPRVTEINSYLHRPSAQAADPDAPVEFEPEALMAIGQSVLPEGDTVRGGIILGYYAALALGLAPGDPVLVFSDFKEHPTTRQPVAVVRTFIVTGLYSSGIYEIDANVAYVALDEAQALFDLGDSVTRVDVRVEDPDKVETTESAIMQRWGLRYDARTWKELRGSFFAAMEFEKRLTFITLTLIILVAGFSIATTQIMLVMEKIREIGILKAMGAGHGGILRIFMLNGTIIGVAGAVLGTAVALLICWMLRDYLIIELPSDVYQIDQVPVKIGWGYIIAVNVLSVLICWLATLYPAFRASRFKPVEALRYE